MTPTNQLKELSILNQRKTQTAEYWQKQFQVTSQDIEAIYQQIIEQNQAVKLEDIAVALVQRHCDAEELASRSELQEGKLYEPKGSFAVDETLIFPALEYAVGKVTASRPGRHPDFGSFNVITVDFGSGDNREFAANFTHDHPLNAGSQILASVEGLKSPEELYSAYREVISKKIKSSLSRNDDLVEFHDTYFLRAGLNEFHEGLFNIADAAIDINQGPLAIDDLIEQMGMFSNADEITDVARFTVNYHLANDERFIDVGPSGQVAWYLERIEPPEVTHPPRRLQVSQNDYDPAAFDEDLYTLLPEIDDEATRPEDAAPADPTAKKTTLVLNYPHWRVGTLPITPKTRSFFPTSNYNPVLFEFIDGRTGDTFPGWTVSEHNYVFGLEEWYQKNKLPVGAYIILKRTNSPMQIVVDFEATRTQRDWVRMAKVVNHKLTFQMNPSPIGCKYDDLMIIGDATPEDTDKLWVTAEERHRSLFQLLCDIFPELSKLNPQSTVHAKTLYSAVNVVKRVSPGVIFQELASHRCFIPMNHGYWTYDPTLRD